KAEVTPTRQPILQRGISVGSISVLPVVTAVVDANYVSRRAVRLSVCVASSSRNRRDAIDQPLIRLSTPISWQRRPHHRAKTQFLCSHGQPWAAQSPGRAEQFRRCAGDPFDRLLTDLQLLAGSRRSGSK